MNTSIPIFKMLLKLSLILVAFYGTLFLSDMCRTIIYLTAFTVRNSKNAENGNDSVASWGNE